jgi:tetraacyldisaccharide 4'-kinase
VLDGLDPFAGGWTFPAGRLREPVSALARADVIALTRTEDRRFDAVIDRVRSFNRDAPIVHIDTMPVCWIDAAAGARLPLDAFQSHDCDAFCGLGNPEAFRRTLSRRGYRPTVFRAFPDHHVYSASDLAGLHRGVTLTTEKDAVKLSCLEVVGVYYLAIEADVQPLLPHVHRVFTQA